MERKQSRKRLRPWLEHHVNAGTFRGLKWFNKERKTFFIYWKHQSNRSWDSSDAELFKAWALHTGKYKEGDHENPPEWKTRLRTALTKLSDIEEMKELHNLSDQENPYKAYRFLDEATVNSSNHERQPSPISESGYSDSSNCSSQTSPFSQRDFLEESDSEMDQDGGMNDMNNIPTVVLEKAKFHPMDHINIRELKPSNVPASDIYGPPIDQAALVSNLPTNFQFDRMHPHDNFNTAAQPQQQETKLPEDLQAISEDGLLPLDSKLTQNNLSLGSSLPSLEPFSISSLSHHILEMQVYILGKCVYQDFIDGEARLFCGNSGSLTREPETCKLHGLENIFGSMSLRQIPIPEIDKMNDLPFINAKQIKLIRDTQTNMDRGLLIGGDSTTIYTKRLCKARVSIWSQMRTVEILNRDNSIPCIKAFDLELFKQQLGDYCKHNFCQPSPSITFIFGQPYKGNYLELDQVLFCVKITHLEAKTLLQQAVNSVSMTTEDMASKSNPEDALAELVKEKLTF